MAKTKKMRGYQMAEQLRQPWREFQTHAQAIGYHLPSALHSLEKSEAKALMERVKARISAPVKPTTPTPLPANRPTTFLRPPTPLLAPPPAFVPGSRTRNNAEQEQQRLFLDAFLTQGAQGTKASPSQEAPQETRVESAQNNAHKDAQESSKATPQAERPFLRQSLRDNKRQFATARRNQMNQNWRNQNYRHQGR